MPEPMCRHGFHPQEIIDVLFNCGYAITPFELHPQLAPSRSVQPIKIICGNRFPRIVNTTRGVLTGRTHRCGHAVAYDHGVVCDPRGTIYNYSDSNDFIANCAWIITRTRTNCEAVQPSID